MQIYNAGLDALGLWQQQYYNYYWLLLQGGSFDRDDDDVSQVLFGGNEVTVGGYFRQQVTGAVRTRNDTLDRMEYTCDNPNYGSLDTGETITNALLIRDPDNDDSTAIPIGWITFAVTRDTADFNPMTINIPDGLVAYSNEA